MQKRRELVPGQRTIGYECTVGVDSADAAAKPAEANGGKVILAKRSSQPSANSLQDPEGNIVGATKYDEQQKARIKG